MDSNGAYLLGASTFEAVETEISAKMRYAQEEEDWQSSHSFEWWPEVSARLARPGIVPDPSRAGRNYDDGHAKSVMPTVPEGRTGPMVGTYSPARTRRCVGIDSEIVDASRDWPVDSCIDGRRSDRAGIERRGKEAFDQCV